MVLNEADLQSLAEKFCATLLPESVCADPCVSISGYKHPRHGTNLLTVAEAKQVLRETLSELFTFTE